MQTCPECASVELSYDSTDQRTYCAACGWVQEVAMVNEAEFFEVGGRTMCAGVEVSEYNAYSESAGSSSRNYNQKIDDYNRDSKRNLFLFVEGFIGRVGLAATYEAQVKNLLLKLFKDKWSSGKKAKLQAACCVYLVARIQKKPITLRDIANALSFDVNKLGPIFREVSSKVINKNQDNNIEDSSDYSMFVERASNYLNMSGNDRRDVCNLAEKFIKMAKSDSLLTGRRPVAVYGAALILALEMFGVKASVNLKSCAGTLKIGEGTIRSRLKEFKTLLVQIGQKLPWGKQINEQNVITHSKEILKFYDLQKQVQNSSSKKDPEIRSNPIPTVSSSAPLIKSSNPTSASGNKRKFPFEEPTPTPTKVPKVDEEQLLWSGLDGSPVEEEEDGDEFNIQESDYAPLSPTATPDQTLPSNAQKPEKPNHLVIYPPSYQKSLKTRGVRQKKIERAKLYLGTLMKGSNIKLFDYLNIPPPATPDQPASPSNIPNLVASPPATPLTAQPSSPPCLPPPSPVPRPSSPAPQVPFQSQRILQVPLGVGASNPSASPSPNPGVAVPVQFAAQNRFKSISDLPPLVQLQILNQLQLQAQNMHAQQRVTNQHPSPQPQLPSASQPTLPLPSPAPSPLLQPPRPPFLSHPTQIPQLSQILLQRTTQPSLSPSPQLQVPQRQPSLSPSPQIPQQVPMLPQLPQPSPSPSPQRQPSLSPSPQLPQQAPMPSQLPQPSPSPSPQRQTQTQVPPTQGLQNAMPTPVSTTRVIPPVVVTDNSPENVTSILPPLPTPPQPKPPAARKKTTTNSRRRSQKKEEKEIDLHDFTDFDTEDLILQKLLLAGLPEHQLLDLPLKSLQALYHSEIQGLPGLFGTNPNQPAYPSHDLNAPELSEKDITDEEVLSLINTPSEVNFLRKYKDYHISTDIQPKVKTKIEFEMQDLEKEQLGKEKDELAELGEEYQDEKILEDPVGVQEDDAILKQLEMEEQDPQDLEDNFHEESAYDSNEEDQTLAIKHE